MNLSLNIKAMDVAKVVLKHPATKEVVGTLVVAGPDHEVMKQIRRDAIDRIQKPGGASNVEEETRKELVARTLGWEGIKNKDTGEEVAFDASVLPELYKQFWLRRQVLEAINDDGFFYRE